MKDRMQRECEYCGCRVDENSTACPHCGAELTAVTNTGSVTSRGTPETIEELKQWYTEHGLPPEHVTRFFIGKDIKEPKAIGIYEENGIFTVYKNKANGERAVRYSGTDEAHAVNEIFTKLKSEIANQKSRNSAPSRSTSGKRSRSKKKGSKPQSKEDLITDIIAHAAVILLFLGIVGGGIVFAIFDKSPSNGYYRYNDTDYYYQDRYWYYYDDTTDVWYPDKTGIGEVFGNHSDDYRVYGHTGTRFEDSYYYHDSSSDDSSDDDSYWDSDDSWDSDSMDWDSDW